MKQFKFLQKFIPCGAGLGFFVQTGNRTAKIDGKYIFANLKIKTEKPYANGYKINGFSVIKAIIFCSSNNILAYVKCDTGN